MKTKQTANIKNKYFVISKTKIKQFFMVNRKKKNPYYKI